MLRRFAFTLMFLAVFAFLGGHWAVMQTVAWVEMIKDYSQEEGSILEGVKKTFSGEAPCEMCRKIREGRNKEEKQNAPMKVEKKGDAFLLPANELALRPESKSFAYPVIRSLRFPIRNTPPPSPVPIGTAIS